MNIRECWIWIRDSLKALGIDDPSIEGEAIIRYSLSIDRAQFFSTLENRLSDREKNAIKELVNRRLSGEPLPYILMNRDFYGLEMYVDKHVLIPRQETELIVDKIVEIVKEGKHIPVKVADVGTGSGAIAVAAATQLPQIQVYATDSSKEALRVATLNCRQHNVGGQIQFFHGDLLSALPEPVDIIASNPPYIPTRSLKSIPQDVKHEPVSSLDGGHDGLQIIEKVLTSAPNYLNHKGQVLIEIGENQLTRVVKIAQRAFPEASITSDQDLLGFPRVVCITT